MVVVMRSGRAMYVVVPVVKVPASVTVVLITVSVGVKPSVIINVVGGHFYHRFEQII